MRSRKKKYNTKQKLQVLTVAIILHSIQYKQKLQRLLNTTKIKMRYIDGKHSYVQSTRMCVKFCHLEKKSFFCPEVTAIYFSSSILSCTNLLKSIGDDLSLFSALT